METLNLPIWRTETLDGKVYHMAAPTLRHGRVSTNILRIFDDFLRNRRCEVFEGPDVYLTPNDVVEPDIVVVCDRTILQDDGIHGSPDLVAEILSPSTAKRDIGYKKRLYEQCKIKEYWIVDAKSRSINVFVLDGEKYAEPAVYVLPEPWELAKYTKDELTEIETEFTTSLYGDDLVIKLSEVFYRLDKYNW